MSEKKKHVTHAQQVQLDRLAGLAGRTVKVQERANSLAKKAQLARQFTDDVRRAEEIVERR